MPSLSGSSSTFQCSQNKQEPWLGLLKNIADFPKVNYRLLRLNSTHKQDHLQHCARQGTAILILALLGVGVLQCSNSTACMRSNPAAAGNASEWNNNAVQRCCCSAECCDASPQACITVGSSRPVAHHTFTVPTQSTCTTPWLMVPT